MVRRCEQDALRRYALRLRRKQLAAAAATGEQDEQGGKKSSSDSQETRGSLTPDVDDVHPSGENNNPGKGRNFLLRLIHEISEATTAFSDALLSRVALEAHYIGKERGLDPNPSNGVLEFPGDKENPTTGDPLVDITNHPQIPLYYRSILTGEKKKFVNEPSGAVGLKWRKFLIKYYGPLLVHPISKVIVLMMFTIILAAGMYGCSQIDSGLDLTDLAPTGSYLNKFDVVSSTFFADYDFPVDVFFPVFERWWDPEVQKRMRNLERIMKESGSGKLVTNPLIRMLDDAELKPGLQSGDRKVRK